MMQVTRDIRTADVSVVIPTYNRASLVTRAIHSVLNQTVAPREIIVVDDGSKDNTAEVIRAFGPPVRYVSQVNSGVAAARNTGVRHAQGDWVAFLDSDDDWLPHKLERQLELLDANPDVVWSCCNFEYLIGDRVKSSGLSPVMAQKLGRGGVIHFFDGLQNNLAIGTCGFLVRSKVLAEVGEFDPSLAAGEDRDIWFRIGMRYPRLAYSTEVCWRYIQGHESLTRRGRNRNDAMRMVLKCMRIADSLGPDAVKAYGPYGKMLAHDFLLRAAAGQAEIDAALLADARNLFPPSTKQRLLMRSLACLPNAIALKIAERLRR